MGAGKCLDVPNGTQTSGTQLEIYDCNGATNQRCYLNANGTSAEAQSGLCLDMTNAAPATERWSSYGYGPTRAAATSNGTSDNAYVRNSSGNPRCAQRLRPSLRTPPAGAEPCLTVADRYFARHRPWRLNFNNGARPGRRKATGVM